MTAPERSSREDYYLNKSSVLSNEGEFFLIPKVLVMVYGINCSMFIQQLHFRIRGTRHLKTKKEGRHWYFCTLKEWITDDFPFWSEDTIGRVIKKLKDDGVVIVGEYNRMSGDRTNWYTLDYEKLWKIEREYAARRVPLPQVAVIPAPQVADVRQPQVAVVIPIEDKKSNLKKPQPPASPPVTTTSADLAIVVKKDTNEKTRASLEKKFAARELPPSVQDLETYWRTLLSMYDYHQNLTFGKQEVGNMKTLRKEIESTGVKVHHFLEYCVQNWKTLRAKITWENKEKSRLGETPSFRTIFFNRHDILAIMQQNGGGKKEEKKTRTYTREVDLPAMHPARREQMADMIRKLGSVTI